MASISRSVHDFKKLDQLAMGDTALHRLDPRAKVLATAAYILAVVSFGKYELSAMLPFCIFPLVVISRGDIPFRSIFRKVLLVIPFALFVGIWNPLFDRQIMLTIGPYGISGGWVSCASIVVRSVLTVAGALTLVGITGFNAICQALESLGMPKAFAVQLLFLYRYIFVLTDEGGRVARARELRSFGEKGKGIVPFSSLIGHLLLRTWQRAERIHMAMLARGFNGEFHSRNETRFGWPEVAFLSGWLGVFIILRTRNVSEMLGSLLTGSFK